MNKILIIQTAFLGDVILATPVVTELKRLYPNAQIDFLVRKGNESLLKNFEAIDSVLTLDKKQGKLKEIVRLRKVLRKEKYDLVLNLHRFGSSGVLVFLSNAKLKYGFAKNPFSFSYTKKFSHQIGNSQHEVERNLSLIKEFGAKDKTRPSLFPSREDYQKVAPFIQQKYVCFAPASVWFTKQFPVKKWIELSSKINEEYTIYLIGGPGDVELCETVKEGSTHLNIQNMAGKFSLLESAALIKSAVRTYVNDSGPLHIASAMNAPVTAFFCSTVPSFGFGPLSDDVKIGECSEQLSCRPCGLHGHKSCPKGDFKCGDTIELSADLIG